MCIFLQKKHEHRNRKKSIEMHTKFMPKSYDCVFDWD